MENMCYRILLAAAYVDESDHLALVNADEEVVSKEEGERGGGAAEGEGGGCCYAKLSLSHTCGDVELVRVSYLYIDSYRVSAESRTEL